MLTISIALIFSTLLIGTCSQGNKKCRERIRPVTTNDGDLYELIDATLDQKLVLECHYCGEKDDSRPRNWYKVNKMGLNEPHEVQPDMENNPELNRIQCIVLLSAHIAALARNLAEVNTEHSLIINNFTENDTGLYYCLGLEQQDESEKYNYLVDLVYEINQTEIESGNISAWMRYFYDYFEPANELLRLSNGKEYVHVREELKLRFELVSQWEPWGTCEVCGHAKGEAVRKKRGHCYIKITQNGKNTSYAEEDVYFLKVKAVSCRSVRLSRVFPGIGNLTKVIPDFIQHESCEGICNPDAEGVNRGWKMGKSKAFKYRKTFVLPVESHLTLVCPESTLDNEVTWKYRGKALHAGAATNPNVLVDTFNTLYLVDITEEQAGNYTCKVDDIKMQQVVVFVVPKSRLLTREFVRHLVYLGFILSLTGTCYCAGLIVTWNRRKTFKNFEELIDEHPEDRGEYEHLL
ncbi:hypothetical protein NQ318_000355 [Aromia moschata]|uniref:Ig-like domain-containing protein n=1 Tax=Aromia moschata TaxID=1265417 RepID=A0AAV8XUK8_9CUCU|nr:hypothetical protein NQ318_000355 [Aromia moschata]